MKYTTIKMAKPIVKVGQSLQASMSMFYVAHPNDSSIVECVKEEIVSNIYKYQLKKL